MRLKIRPDINLDKIHEQYQPYRDRLYRLRIGIRLQENRSFANVWRNNLTAYFLKDLADITNPQHHFTQNFVVMMSGDTGSGKSICILSLGLTIFPKFSWRNIFFFDQQILDVADKFPENTLLVRDENPIKAVYGQGSNRIASQFSVMAETCRKAGLNLALVEPSFTTSDIAKYYLETVDLDVHNRVTRLALMDARTLKYIGAVYIPIVDESNEDWINYNKRKDIFIERIKRGELQDAKLDLQSMAKKLADEIDITTYITKKEREAYLVSKYPNLTTSEIKTIGTLLEIELRKSVVGN